MILSSSLRTPQTIIILGTVLLPVATGADIHPVVFAIIGIVSLAFGLVTPPYGLCLLISASISGLNVVQVMRDVSGHCCFSQLYNCVQLSLGFKSAVS